MVYGIRGVYWLLSLIGEGKITVLSRSMKVATAVIGMCVCAAGASANSSFELISKSSQSGGGNGERYVPTIWVDPDGCEHWAMDDGAEGYMTPHVTREGIPVCRRGNTCGVESSDQLFAVDKSWINSAARARLKGFFRGAGASAFSVDGHTDSDASDAYNMALSLRRAEAVAEIARSVGVEVKARGYGERSPVASNATAAGKRKNRRVEINCIR